MSERTQRAAVTMAIDDASVHVAALHKKGRPVATDPHLRAEALRIAAEHGAVEASRRTGVPASTIRAWRSRSGNGGPPAGVDPSTWAELKETAARDTWEAASTALGKVRELLDAGKTADAQRAALTMAIALDKSLLLEAAAAAARNRTARISEDTAQTMVEVLTKFFAVLELPFTQPLRKLLAELLRAGQPPKAPASVVKAARDELLNGSHGVSTCGGQAALTGDSERVQVPGADGQAR